MNLYITSGTPDFLLKLKEKHQGETMVLMNNNESSLLVHETDKKTVFSSPRKYEVIDSAGNLGHEGFAVFNNIPVTDEGRPLFEDRFLNRPRLIENEPGFIAIRVLRPLSSNTYIIMTIWKNESSFENWQKSKAYENAHKKRGTEAGIDGARPNIFESASYVSKYYIEGE
ncbi:MULTISPECIES: antibiotic biosynthesis monooxygenase family protein [Mesobacillus]|uniref:antibiotic biosynthesis monooxygenase family protein n=1 Tax=Mesobacillus TaxID=2675231 RepID=UPI00178691BF|nr:MULTISPECIES: antibiotic biosynthesis monooxygenase [Mesobacillus]MCM3573351.1 antibiotic biosynthesis monooxygenase [Mesobacillus subterraneus]UYZ23104.1 antibiotic biosynthesis monooxygenase [Mesobacillus jeotgali]